MDDQHNNNDEDLEQRDKQRVEAEQEYSRTHPERVAENEHLNAEEKSQRLKKKLDAAIAIVIGLIIITYLILFYV